MEKDPLDANRTETEPSNIQRVGRSVADFFRGTREQLRTADLNPHEGRLRASVAPAEYMDIPDYPPIHDDTI